MEVKAKDHQQVHDALTHFSGQARQPQSWAHPSHARLARWFDRYVAWLTLFGSIFVYLQAATIIKNKSSENVSMPSYIVLLIVALSMLAYGVLWTDWTLALGGTLASVGAIVALVATVSYRPSTTPGPFSTL